MSRNQCASCSACKGINKTYCDKCSAFCCQENMRNHTEIFYLGDQFRIKVNDAENELKSKAEQVRVNLSNKYNIYIGQCTCCLEHCENFLNMMKSKYNEMNNLEYNLISQIEQNERDFKNNKLILSNEFNYKLKTIKDSFENEKKIIIDEKEKENEKINPINKLKMNLEEEKEKIKKINVDEIVNNFISEEKMKIEHESQIQKNKIDEENQFKDEKLEYTEDEKNLENNYLNIINGIKKYSNKIPYFDNWLEVYKLKKYIK